MEWVTSKDNRWVKESRRLLTQRKARKETGLFVAEGARLCQEAARCGLLIHRLLVTREALDRYPVLLAPVLEAAREVLGISEELAHSMGDTKTPQGVFALCQMPEPSPLELRPQGRYLILESIQDPANLGTIIRTADAFGATALILSPDVTDCYSPRVLRGAMGSVFRMPIFYTSLDKTLETMYAINMPVYAATLEEDSVPIQQLGRLHPGGMAVVVGNEGAGVHPNTIARCGRSVHIPMGGATESLNAAVAASIILWEICGRD